MISAELNDNIIRTLRPFGPEKVILFGSHAYGTPGNNSDIDLLIIKSITTSKVRDLRIQIRKALRGIPETKEFDIIVDSQERIGKRIEIGDLFLKEISEKGKIIYAE
jgi:predicted nucleotidyltransferase